MEKCFALKTINPPGAHRVWVTYLLHLGAGEGDGKGVAVPYRESKLTQLLRQALGGDARTLVIVAARDGDRG